MNIWLGVEFNKLRNACVCLGRRQSNIQKIILFGSKIDGVRSSKKRLDQQSDWDIAIEFVPFSGEDHLTTWVCEAKKWKRSLVELINDCDFGEIDFQSYSLVDSPHVVQYVKEKSIVLFDRSIHC